MKTTPAFAMLRRNLPDLKSDKGEHFTDILTNLYKRQMRLIWEEQKAYEQRTAEVETQRSQAATETAVGSTTIESEAEMQVHNRSESPCQISAGAAVAGNGHVDKSSLPISTPRRIRDKDHLRYVASQPCIICGRSPSHAHHIRFAQPKAFGRKVSDEWTVPLCSTHHRALHGVGDERQWWAEKGLDPTTPAVRLWWDTRHGGSGHANKFAAARSNVEFDGQEGPKKGVKRIDPKARSDVNQVVRVKHP